MQLSSPHCVLSDTCMHCGYVHALPHLGETICPECGKTSTAHHRARYHQLCGKLESSKSRQHISTISVLMIAEGLCYSAILILMLHQHFQGSAVPGHFWYFLSAVIFVCHNTWVHKYQKIQEIVYDTPSGLLVDNKAIKLLSRISSLASAAMMFLGLLLYSEQNMLGGSTLVSMSIIFSMPIRFSIVSFFYAISKKILLFEYVPGWKVLSFMLLISLIAASNILIYYLISRQRLISTDLIVLGVCTSSILISSYWIYRFKSSIILASAQKCRT